MKGGSNENFRVFRVDRGILPRSWQLLSNKVNAYFSFPFPCSIPPRDARQITRDQLWETLTVTRLHTEKGKGGREKMWNCRDRSCRFVEENRQRYGAWEEFFFSFLFWEWTLVKLEGKLFNSNMQRVGLRSVVVWISWNILYNGTLITLLNGYDLLFKRSFSYYLDQDSELKLFKSRNKSTRRSKKTCYRTKISKIF